MGRRLSIEVPGFGHDNPIPAACKVGPFLISSGVSGKEPYTGKMPEGLEAQCAQMFATVRQDPGNRRRQPRGRREDERLDERPLPAATLMNVGWLEMFPDEHSRPARHTFAAPDLPGTMLVQCEISLSVAFYERMMP